MDGHYLVSSDGDVCNVKTGNWLKGRYCQGFYLRVSCLVDGKYKDKKIHHLVSEAFFGLRAKGFVVNHKDGNKHNNCKDNLEYVTLKQNTAHAIRIGIFKNPNQRVKRNLNKDQVFYIRYLLSNNFKPREVSKITGIKPQDIYTVKLGHSYRSWP